MSWGSGPEQKRKQKQKRKRKLKWRLHNGNSPAPIFFFWFVVSSAIGRPHLFTKGTFYCPVAHSSSPSKGYGILSKKDRRVSKEWKGLMLGTLSREGFVFSSYRPSPVKLSPPKNRYFAPRDNFTGEGRYICLLRTATASPL